MMQLMPIRFLVAALLAVSPAVMPRYAAAGRLDAVTKEVAETQKARDNNGAGDRGDDSAGDLGPAWPDDDGSALGGAIVVSPRASAPGCGAHDRIRADFYTGLSKVIDSDTAVSLHGRLQYRSLGFELGVTRYREAPPKRSADPITMDVWAVTGHARPLAYRGFEVWILGGLGVLGSSEFSSVSGGLIGAMARHQLRPALAIDSTVRWYFLDPQLDAVELTAGVQASIFRVGYRRLELNVGPPLFGPEVGVAIAF